MVGGLSVVALGAALFSGFRGEPEPCEDCLGSGGIACLVCEGSGKRKGPINLEETGEDAAARTLGLTRGNPYDCRVCVGLGRMLCRKCMGSGYVNT